MSVVKVGTSNKKLGIHDNILDSKNNNAPIFKIERFSDVIKSLRINDANSPLRTILDDVKKREDDETPWVGVTDGGFSRPFRSGLWFRGQANSELKVTPTIFRGKDVKDNTLYIDEKNCFNELRLRIGDSEYYNSGYFDVLCRLRHHSLPCRLLDWTESPSVALYFACKNAVEFQTDAVFSAINVFRVNQLSSIFGSEISPGIGYPHHLDVIIRSAMSSHMYIEDVHVQAANQFSNYADSKT